MKDMTRRNFLKVAGASATVAGLALAGCDNGGGTDAPAEDGGDDAAEGGSVEGMTVAFIPKVTGNAFFESANNGAQEYAGTWGITVDYQGSPQAAVADQVEVINQAVANGADAICISTVDANGVSEALKAATEAGVVVTTWDSDANPEDRTLMVSQGTPDILADMLIEMAVAGLKDRGVDAATDPVN